MYYSKTHCEIDHWPLTIDFAAQPRAFLWLPFFWRNKRKEESKWAICARWTIRWMLLATSKRWLFVQSISLTFCGQKVTKRLVEKRRFLLRKTTDDSRHKWRSRITRFEWQHPQLFTGSLESPLSLVFRRFYYFAACHTFRNTK